MEELNGGSCAGAVGVAVFSAVAIGRLHILHHGFGPHLKSGIQHQF